MSAESSNLKLMSANRKFRIQKINLHPKTTKKIKEAGIQLLDIFNRESSSKSQIKLFNGKLNTYILECSEKYKQAQLKHSKKFLKVAFYLNSS